nr:integrase arm-type DNA-binding domain-containing protein [Novosphingobium sp. SG707]
MAPWPSDCPVRQFPNLSRNFAVALKELQIRNLHPADKTYQCTDDRGLYLEINPNGSKLWRYKYRHMGKQKRLALRRYPEVGLADARRRRDDARRKLEAGSDPLAERKHDKLVAAFKTANSFGDIAKEYIDKMVAEGRADTTTTKAIWQAAQRVPDLWEALVWAGWY